MNLSNYTKNLITQKLVGKNIIDIFLYDTKKDIDGGAWRNDKNAQMSSWYNETLNTATRGSKREFPEVAIIAIYVNGGYNNYIIYDANDLSMWAIFNGTSALMAVSTVGSVKSVFMLNGILWVACTNNSSLGILNIYDFKKDQCGGYQGTAGWRIGTSTISQRNNTTLTQSQIGGDSLINLYCNCVHGATINGTDYIAVATDGGVSLINMTTSRIFNVTYTARNFMKRAFLTNDGTLFYHISDASSPTSETVMIKHNVHTLTASINDSYDGVIAAPTSGVFSYSEVQAPMYKNFVKKNDTLIIGTGTSLGILKHKTGTPLLATRIHTNKVVTGLCGWQGGRWITGFGSAIDESAGNVVDHKGVDSTGLSRLGSPAVALEATPSFGYLKGYVFNPAYGQYMARADFGSGGQNMRFSTAFTLGMIFKTNSIATTQMMFNKSHYADMVGGGYWVRIDNTTGVVHTTIYKDTSNCLELVTPSGSIAANNLYFVVITYDGQLKVASGLKTFINGVDVRGTITQYGTFDVLNAPAQPFSIGASDIGSGLFNGTIYGAFANSMAMPEEAIQEMWKQVQAIKNQSPALADMCLKGNSSYVNGVDLDDNGNIIYATGDGSNTGIVAKYDPDNLTHVENLSGITDSYGNAMTSTKFNNVKFLSQDLIGIAGQSDAFLENLEHKIDDKEKDDRKLMSDILRRFPNLMTRPRQYDFTSNPVIRSINAAVWTTTRAVFTPYKTRSGAWRVFFNVGGSFTSSPSSYQGGIYAPVTFKSGCSQAIANYADVSSGGTFAHAPLGLASSNQIFSMWNPTQAFNCSFVWSGDCELESKPDKAYFPYIDEMDF